MKPDPEALQEMRVRVLKAVTNGHSTFGDIFRHLELEREDRRALNTALQWLRRHHLAVILTRPPRWAVTTTGERWLKAEAP